MSRQPVKHTRPDIDALLTRLESIKRICNGTYGNEDELRDALAMIDNEVYGFDGELEDLRRSNDSLRSWGSEEESEVDELRLSNDALQDDLDALQEKYDTLMSEYDEARKQLYE